MIKDDLSIFDPKHGFEAPDSKYKSTTGWRQRRTISSSNIFILRSCLSTGKLHTLSTCEWKQRAATPSRKNWLNRIKARHLPCEALSSEWLGSLRGDVNDVKWQEQPSPQWVKIDHALNKSSRLLHHQVMSQVCHGACGYHGHGSTGWIVLLISWKLSTLQDPKNNLLIWNMNQCGNWHLHQVASKAEDGSMAATDSWPVQWRTGLLYPELFKNAWMTHYL